MPSELDLHAYVFLGNALNWLVNGARLDYAVDTGATGGELARMYEAIEPLSPADILDGIAGLAPEKRDLLLRSARWIAGHLGPEFSSVTGVTEAEAAEVIAWLAAQSKQRSGSTGE